MTDVHYKIRHTTAVGKRFDEFVKLPPTPFGSSRVEQLFQYCVDKCYRLNSVVILEDARATTRLPLLTAYQRWLNTQ